VLLATVRPNLRGFGYIDFDAVDLICSTGFSVLAAKDNCHGRFLYYSLYSSETSRYFHGCVVGSGYPALNNSDVDHLKIPLPPLPEQNKIAEILSTWDEGIEQTRQLIAAAKRRKKALMQKLLTGKKRLMGFKAKWTPKRLSVITERITNTTEHPENYPVLSITAGTGFVSQADKFSRVIAGKHIENYVLLKRGEFSYNKGNSYRYPQGCVYQLHEYDEGLVPDVFYSFRLNPACAHDGFIKQFFIAGLHNRPLYRCVNTGVRNNGLLNLNASDFFNLEVVLPDLDEQRAIAAVLAAAAEEIAGRRWSSKNVA